MIRKLACVVMILWFLPFTVAVTLLRWIADFFEAVGLLVYRLANFVDSLGVWLTFGYSSKILRWVRKEAEA